MAMAQRGQKRVSASASVTATVSALPVARRPSLQRAAFTTSTPARSNGALSAMPPAPLPTPLDRLPVLSEADSTFFRDDKFVGGGDDNEETALMGLDYDIHAENVQDTFIGSLVGQENQEIAETTAMLQQRAFANNSLGAGLGGKLFEMLMSQSQSAQPVSVAIRPTQDVLHAIDLGNSQLGKDRRFSSPKKARISTTDRRNERSSIGPSGQGFIDFDTDVRFGDDLLGRTSREPSPKEELCAHPILSLPQPFSFRNLVPATNASVFRQGSRPLSQNQLVSVSGCESVAALCLRPLTYLGHCNANVREALNSPRDSIPVGAEGEAQFAAGEQVQPATEEQKELPAAQKDSAAGIAPLDEPPNAAVVQKGILPQLPIVAETMPLRETVQRRSSTSSISSFGTRTSPRKARPSASATDDYTSHARVVVSQTKPMRRQSKRISFTKAANPIAPPSLQHLTDGDIRESKSTVNEVMPLAIDQSKAASPLDADYTSGASQFHATQTQITHVAIEEIDEYPSASQARPALSADLPSVYQPAIQQDGKDHTPEALAAGEEAQFPLPSSDEFHLFSTIASSPQVDRTRRRRPQPRASTIARHPLAASTNLSPVVEEKSISRSRISAVNDHSRRISEVGQPLSAVAAVPDEEEAEMSIVQSKIQEVHAELSRIFAKRLSDVAEHSVEAEENDCGMSSAAVLAAVGGVANREEINGVITQHYAGQLSHCSPVARALDLAASAQDLAILDLEEEDIPQRPILHTFIADDPEQVVTNVDSVNGGAASAQLSGNARRPSVFDRLGPSMPDRQHQDQPTSRQSSQRSRSRQSTSASLTVSKPYDRPSSRTSIRSEVPTVASISTKAPSRESRTAQTASSRQAQLAPRHLDISETETGGRTISVPVNFSPKPKPKPIQRQKGDDDMFSRKQRDRSRSRSSEAVRTTSAARPASRAESRTSMRSSRTQDTATTGTHSERRPVPNLPKTVAPRSLHTAPTRPTEFRFTESRPAEKRKRDADPDANERVTVEAVQPIDEFGTTSSFKQRCQADLAAIEDEVVVPLTVEALKAQDTLNDSRVDQAADAYSLALMRGPDVTIRSETLQRYLQDLSDAQAAAESRFSSAIAQEARIEQAPVGKDAASSKRVCRVQASETVGPLVRLHKERPSRPHRLHELPAHKRAATRKAVQSVTNARPASATISQPFSFRTSTREQACFTDRLAAWHQREQEAAKSGRPALAPLPVPLARKTANIVSKLRVRTVSGDRREAIKVKQFNFASDARMKERREFEERLKEKERILAELEAIKRAEQEVKEAEEIRKMRAAQIPRAHPLPSFYTGRH